MRTGKPLSSPAQKITSFLSAITDFFFPPLCCICGKVSDKYPFLCAECLHSCTEFAEAPDTAMLHTEHPADDVACMYYFDEYIQKLVHLLKYQDMPFVGECLGERIGRVFRDKPAAGSDILLPVPLHPLRRRERGYNQSACIARGIAKIWKVPVETRLLKRSRNTQSQTRLNREERQENIRGAFQLRNTKKIPERICIIDDVFTTGATTLEIAGLLRESGAKQVHILTLATPRKDQ